MKTGFVFGKFMPFHKGHQAMIAFAASHCDELTVLICCSEKETIPAALRLHWITETFANDKRIKPRVLEYLEEELPNSSVSSMQISELWSRKFTELLPEVQLLVSSEPYGEFVAQYMNIEHIVFDPKRSRVPISGTMIRKNPWFCWEYLPEVVKPYYQRKLVVLGTESTGKTTLAQELALRFQAKWVPEAGRDLIPDSTNFSIDDLYAVAKEHAKRVEEALVAVPALLILDTDIHITQSYAAFSFGEYLELPEEWYQIQKAHLYLYLDKDAPYIQDGSRMHEAERNLLDDSHKATLEHFAINYETLSGDWDLRRKKALFLVADMLFSTF